MFDTCRTEDAELSLGEAEPACDFWYTVRQGDICDSIAAAHRVPTFVPSHFPFAYFIHRRALQCSYQIICENDAINGKCTNLGVGQVRSVLRLLLETF